MFRQMLEEKYMRFPQGKSKALTFSYDDGVRSDARLVEIFDKYGIKGTFNLNLPLCDDEGRHIRLPEQEMLSLFQNSLHEVALHGARHIFLDKVPLPQAVNEVLENRLYLEEKFNRIITGMAYAYNGYNEAVIAALRNLGVTYARTTEATHSFSLPQSWLRLNPTCHHNDPLFCALADKFVNGSPLGAPKHREPWLFYVWGHSFEFDDNGSWHIIEDFCNRISQQKDIWLATNGEIYDYISAYNSLVYSADGETAKNPSYMGVWVEIRGKVYEIPAGKIVKFDK